MKKFVFFLLTSASLTAAPQAVVFDFGDVVASPKREIVVQFLCDSLHLNKEEFTKVNDEKRVALKTGKSEVEFGFNGLKEGV